MDGFMIRFLLCNVSLAGIIGILLVFRRLLRPCLSGRMKYHLWYLLLCLLTVPFLPFRSAGVLPMLSLWQGFDGKTAIWAGAPAGAYAGAARDTAAGFLNDFALSVSREAPSVIVRLSGLIWMTGILLLLLSVIKAWLRLRALRRSALPLQHQEIRRLYEQCLHELKITKGIPIYSTAFLSSPMITGLFRPCIYLPIHLISEYDASDMRYMLLHELQHYKHKDAVAGYLMTLFGILYWFNPAVWYALKEMKNDREIACDASVLQMLPEDCYEAYGRTLLLFAKKVSLSPFPFSAGLSGNMKQMKRRIESIATYERPTFRRRIKGIAAFLTIALLLSGLAPVLSTYAADGAHYSFDTSGKDISYLDLFSYFGAYDGSFVLYDMNKDSWIVHNPAHATLRVSPNSTYKIYDALFGLEAGVITPENSFMEWNRTAYPFAAWNADQTLQSAMQSSVNWYFKALDEQLGAADIKHYLRKIGYGNEAMDGGLSGYWMESSLKISPVEQVQLLAKLYHNSFGFSPENVRAVKDSLFLSASEAGALYGKTGTGNVDGQNINGWFVGYTEAAGGPCFFAVNILADDGATGSRASKIAFSILADMGLIGERHMMPFPNLIPPQQKNQFQDLHK